MAIASDGLKPWSRGEAMREHIQYAVGLRGDGKQEQFSNFLQFHAVPHRQKNEITLHIPTPSASTKIQRESPK